MPAQCPVKRLYAKAQSLKTKKLSDYFDKFRQYISARLM